MDKVGLFCVHGFLEDGEQSFHYLKEALKRNNISNYYLTDLQGHSVEEDINTFNYKICIAQLEEEYKEFKSRHDITYVIGFSMGGVLASHLASHLGADKLVLVSPAFKYGQSTQIARDFVSLMNRSREDESFPGFRELMNFKSEDRITKIQEFINEEFKDLGSSYENFMYRLSRLKMSTFLNFTRLVATVKRNLVLEDIPTRIYHAEFDELVPVAASLYVFGKVNSLDKRLTLVAGVHHRILASNIRDEIIEEILQFLYGKDYFNRNV